MLPSITCTKDQGAGDPKPCESRFPDACDRTKNPTGGGCCVPCGGLAPILPVTGLSLDVRPPRTSPHLASLRKRSRQIIACTI